MVTYKEKMKLRETYKKYKIGLIKEEDLSDEELMLLQKYYGVR